MMQLDLFNSVPSAETKVEKQSEVDVAVTVHHHNHKPNVARSFSQTNVKYRLPRKVLTESEAKTKKENCICQIQNLEEEILYWRLRLNKPLAPIDNFIIMSDKTVNSPEEIIERNIDEIKEKLYRIENYLNTFIN